MRHGPFDPVDQFGRDDHIQKFAPKVVWGGFYRALHLQQLALSAHFDAGFDQVFDQHRAVAGIELPINQQTFRRPANARAPCFGVQHHAARLFHIGVAVGIDVADAFQMRKDRHPRLALHQSHKALAPTRHDDVDVIHRRQHRRHHLAVAGGDQLNSGLRQPRLAQPAHHAVMKGRGGMKAFRPTAQDHGIARLKAQGPCIRRDIGPAFINHANHTQWRRHPLNVQPIRPVPFSQNPPHRIALFGHSAQRIDNAAQAVIVQPQPVQHRGA